MQPKHLQHKSGGQITTISSIGHRTLEKVPYWFFLCDVTWRDGSKSVSTEVIPGMLCADHDNPEAKAELDKVMEAMNTHLLNHGKWLKKGKWVGDLLMHWQAKQPILVYPIDPLLT